MTNEHIIDLVLQNLIDDVTNICCICLEELHENTTTLPCKHGIHTECLNNLLNHTNRCPLCNTQIKTTRTLHIDFSTRDTVELYYCCFFYFICSSFVFYIFLVSMLRF